MDASSSSSSSSVEGGGRDSSAPASAGVALPHPTLPPHPFAKADAAAARAAAKPVPETSLTLLQKADWLTRPSTPVFATDAELRVRLRSVTMNNLAMYHLKTKKPRLALTYLTSVLKIENRSSALGSPRANGGGGGGGVPGQYGGPSDFDNLSDFDNVPAIDNPASTHINICAVLSILKKHKEAAQHALFAVKYLSGIADGQLVKEEGVDQTLRDASGVSLLASAYFNLASQHEAMRNRGSAAEAYRRAYEVARDECVAGGGKPERNDAVVAFQTAFEEYAAKIDPSFVPRSLPKKPRGGGKKSNEEQCCRFPPSEKAKGKGECCCCASTLCRGQ